MTVEQFVRTAAVNRAVLILVEQAERRQAKGGYDRLGNTVTGTGKGVR